MSVIYYYEERSILIIKYIIYKMKEKHIRREKKLLICDKNLEFDC